MIKDIILHEIDHVLEHGVKLHVDRLGKLIEQIEDSLFDFERVLLSSKIKSAAQLEAITEFKLHKYWACIFMATGSGKSKIGVILANQVVIQYLNRRVGDDSSIYPPKILLVVPTKNLRDRGWKEEFDKWGVYNSWDSVETCCYASLAKYEGQAYDLVILDEGHNLTPASAVFFDNNEVRACIMLTGTKPNDPLKVATYKRLRLNPAYELGLDECVTLRLISPYEVTVIEMTLDDKNKCIEAGSKTKKFKVTEKGQYKYLSDRTKAIPSKFNFLARARFIYNLQSKTQVASLILHHVIPDHLRTIIFCGSIAQSEQLCTNFYHSKTDDTAFKLFLDGIINRLACVDAINEGTNVDNLDVGFIVQLNSSDIDLGQRIGRLLRYRPGHKGRIIVLITTDTVEKDWLVKATSNLDPTKIRSIKLSDLRIGKETISFN